MIAKVVFVGDPYRGEQAVNINNIRKLFSPVLRQLGVTDECFITEFNRSSDRESWLPRWEKSLKYYTGSFSAEIDLRDAGVIGFEIPDAELNDLSAKGIPWINFSIHPLRFLDDLYFDVQTSFEFSFGELSASAGLIDFCARKFFISPVEKNRPTAPKTLLVCGQVWFDRSVYFDGKFHGLEDYVPQLDELVRGFERVLYKPHPFWASTETAQLMADRYQAQNCVVENIYELFASGEVHTATAISSSILTEAPFFGVHAKFLESRAKRYGPAISYRALLDDAKFWESGFLGNKRSLGPLRISPAVPSNHLRKVFTSWGFVTEETRLESRVAAMGDKIHAVTTAVQDWSQRASELEVLLHRYKEHAIAVASTAQEHTQRAYAAEALAQERAQRADKAEALLKEHERREAAAEALVKEHERRAAVAEALVKEHEQRATAAKALVKEHECRAAAANALAKQNLSCAAAAEALVQEHERRAATAEALTRERDQHIVLIEARVQEQKIHIEELGKEAHYWRQQANALYAEFDILRQSASWRITAPLRGIGMGLRWMSGMEKKDSSTIHLMSNHMRKYSVLFLNKVVAYAQSSPNFKRLVMLALRHAPRLTNRLLQIHLTSQRAQIFIADSFDAAEANSLLSTAAVDGGRLRIPDFPLENNGTNTSQKTPLEASFAAYRENK